MVMARVMRDCTLWSDREEVRESSSWRIAGLLLLHGGVQTTQQHLLFSETKAYSGSLLIPSPLGPENVS